MRNGKCPKCGSNKVGHLAELTDEFGGDKPSPETLGLRKESPENVRWWQHPYRREGAVEAYVCTSCGFFETYVKDPGSVPFESLEGFSWVGAKDEGPYR